MGGSVECIRNYSCECEWNVFNHLPLDKKITESSINKSPIGEKSISDREEESSSSILLLALRLLPCPRVEASNSLGSFSLEISSMYSDPQGQE